MKITNYKIANIAESDTIFKMCGQMTTLINKHKDNPFVYENFYLDLGQVGTLLAAIANKNKQSLAYEAFDDILLMLQKADKIEKENPQKDINENN